MCQRDGSFDTFPFFVIICKCVKRTVPLTHNLQVDVEADGAVVAAEDFVQDTGAEEFVL